MALAVFLSCTAKRHALIERDIVSHNGRLSDNYAVSVVDKKVFPNRGSRVNFNPRLSDGTLRNPPCKEKVSVLVQPVRYPVMEHNLKTRIEKNLHIGVNCRITLPNDLDFIFDIFNQSHFAFLLTNVIFQYLRLYSAQSPSFA